MCVNKDICLDFFSTQIWNSDGGGYSGSCSAEAVNEGYTWSEEKRGRHPMSDLGCYSLSCEPSKQSRPLCYTQIIWAEVTMKLADIPLAWTTSQDSKNLKHLHMIIMSSPNRLVGTSTEGAGNSFSHRIMSYCLSIIYHPKRWVPWWNFQHIDWYFSFLGMCHMGNLKQQNINFGTLAVCGHIIPCLEDILSWVIEVAWDGRSGNSEQGFEQGRNFWGFVGRSFLCGLCCLPQGFRYLAPSDYQGFVEAIENRCTIADFSNHPSRRSKSLLSSASHRQPMNLTSLSHVCSTLRKLQKQPLWLDSCIRCGQLAGDHDASRQLIDW